MATTFEWRIEGRWLVKSQEKTAVSPLPWPRWMLTAGLIILLLLSGLLLFRRVENWLTAVQQETAATVEHSALLLLDAAAQEDADLFRALLARPDSRWAQKQQELLAAGRLLDRTPLGLSPASSRTQIRRVEVAPNLQRAEVTADLHYRAADQIEPVTLRQTAVWQQSGDRWRLAAPSPSFWEGEETRQESWLALTYPGRDAAVAERLAADLNGRLERVCRLQERIHCPDDLVVRIRLVTDPAALLLLGEPQRRPLRTESIVLPTVALVGAPVGEAGYQALLDGYAAHVVAAVVLDLRGWDCGAPLEFYRALEDGRWICAG